ncbi:MAG TPA: ATP-binding cassette domain-containing protein [Kofleriaceae bacterium]|nr:ATP-binding cassette domain-containing protein [Kofleriaceae bacterium]
MADLQAKIQLSRSAEWKLDVDLACPAGITCIMGPSGSGKSTILGVLAGLTVPDAGSVKVGNEVWLDRAKGIDVPIHRRRLSYVFQGLALFPHMSALHNVTYGMAHVPREQRAERAKTLLQKLGVLHLAMRRPRTFSGGEAQRVALARALARQPELVLLDEPFSALDRELRTQLIALVREVVADLGVPIVHVTHSPGEARALADQIVRLEKGRVVARGTPAEVLKGVTSLEE